MTPPPDASRDGLVARLLEKQQGLLGLSVSHPHIVSADLLGLLHEAAEALAGHGERPATPAGTECTCSPIAGTEGCPEHGDSPASPAAPLSQWEPIAQFDTRDDETPMMFWIEPKTADEAYVDTSGKPIVVDFKPYMMFGSYGHWPATSKATRFFKIPLPAAPAPASPEEK